MMKPVVAAAIFALTAGVAFAAEDSSTSTKAKEDLSKDSAAGSTAAPTAKPDSGSLSDEQKKDQPGTSTGTTADPNAKPQSGSLPDKADETTK